jgi:hypothetical protein
MTPGVRLAQVGVALGVATLATKIKVEDVTINQVRTPIIKIPIRNGLRL